LVGVNVLLKKIVYPGGALGFECMANTICTWRNKKRERWREKRSWFKAREGRVEPYKTTAKKFVPSASSPYGRGRGTCRENAWVY
jgi:hypothetical protein